MNKKSRPKTPAVRASTDVEETWPGNGAVLQLLRESLAVAKRTEAGVNMMSGRIDQVEKDLVQIKQNLGGVMELGGSVLDAKEQMSKSLGGIRTELHALKKAQIRTYDMITAHAKSTADAAHSGSKASGSAGSPR